MDVSLPYLPETKFESTPTEEQLISLLRDHKAFWTKMAGVLFVTNAYSIDDQQQRMSKLLGAAVQLQMVIDAFQGRSNIATPQLQMVPRGPHQ